MTTYRRKSDFNGEDSPIHLRRKSFSQLLLFLTVFVLAVAVIGTAAALGSNVINNEENAIFEEKWQASVYGQAFAEVILPISKDLPVGSHITLKNHLPEKMVRGATVLLRTSQQDVQVTVGGQMIYSTKSLDKTIASVSSAYHLVRLPEDSAGKTITVSLSSPYANYAGFMSQIYIGSKASNLFFLFRENGLRFVIGFLVFCVGLLLIILFLFVREQESKASFTNLGAFFVCAGYWVLVESKMMQFVFPYPVALTNSSIFALSLLPVFSGLYYYNTHAKTYKRFGSYVIAAVTAASFALALASSVNPGLPIRILPYYLMFMMLYLLLFFVSIISERIRSGRLFTTSVGGIFAFSICALLELVFYLSNMKTYNQSNFLTMGLLLFCILMMVDSMQNFARIYRTAIKVDALSVLAYTDSLTGLKNRTAFLEALPVIDTNGKNFITIAMYDVNNLKTVNDTKGHLAGDALLRHSAKVIKASLRQEDKVYRIGGDEFVAILHHGTDFDCNALKARLLSVMEKENQKKLSYVLSIAYGFATYSQTTDQTLFDTQARADKSMYECKRTQKAGNHGIEIKQEDCREKT